MIIKYNEFHRFQYYDIDVVGIPSGEVIIMGQQQIDYFKARNLIKYKDKLALPNGEITIFEGFVFKDEDGERIKEIIDTITWR